MDLQAGLDPVPGHRLGEVVRRPRRRRSGGEDRLLVGVPGARPAVAVERAAVALEHPQERSVGRRCDLGQIGRAVWPGRVLSSESG